MADQSNNKDTSKTLSKYADLRKKPSNLALDGAKIINDFYKKQLNTVSEEDIQKSRLETSSKGKEDSNTLPVLVTENENRIKTKIQQYSELQTNNKNPRIKISKANKVKTNIMLSKEDKEVIANLVKTQKKKIKTAKRIGKTIKGLKLANNVSTKAIKAGSNINTGLNDGALKSFENSSKILSKPVKYLTKKIGKKATKKVVKGSFKLAKNSTNLLLKLMKLIAKLVLDAVKLIISMLPSMTPVIIILLIIVCFCSFFGIGMSNETMKKYEQYMIETQNRYDATTVAFYQEGKIVDGAIEGKGMINWRAALSIMQMLNGKLSFDSSEKTLLDTFDNAQLYETISDEEYSYVEEEQTITDTKKVVYNPSLDDYINWCNNNFGVINDYKTKKGLNVNLNQVNFTDNEIAQIKILYNSNSFFDLFSDEFKAAYAYTYVDIGDEQLQAIYNEFLKNAGKRYVLDHSNLSYDNCMNYYDCSSWVIHCLAHTGIKVLPNTTAEGIYLNYCAPVNINDRKPGDLIFLKDTYDTGTALNISHIGIYMGEFNINGDKSEWIIDTGGNPTGVKISKYNNGWWNGSNFYGFGRLK